MLLIATTLLLGAGRPPIRVASDFVQTPYVQLGHREDGAANSLAIVWHGPDDNRRYRVQYQIAGQTHQVTAITVNRVALPKVPAFRIHMATLRNLGAGLKVTYSVSTDSSSFAATTQAPKDEKQPYRFVVFGDCGRGTPQQAKIAYQTYLQQPDFVMLTGDIVYNDGRVSEYEKNYFPYYAANVADPKVGAPLLSSTLTVGAPGNHDILNRNFNGNPDALAYFLYWKQPLNGPLRTNGAANTPTLTGNNEAKSAFLTASGMSYPRGANFSFDYGNAHWTILDANPYVDWTSPALRKWLSEDLAKAKGATWRFVALHHPPFHSSKSHEGDKQIRPIADLFEKGNVDIVFGGHVHNYQRTFPIQVGSKLGVGKEELNKDDWSVDRSFDGTRNLKPKGVLYVVDGAGGAPLYNMELNEKPELWKPFQAKYFSTHCFSVVDISGNLFRLKQVDLNGKTIDQFSIRK